MLKPKVKQEIQGAYTRFLDSKGLKARYGQKLMIAEVARTLGGIELDEEEKRSSEGHICVVEAGTGTGKTVAYLLAALPIAKALGKKLVVSTATVALQEQIVHKDLPELKQHSELKFNFALAKGRGRYLCLSKIDRLLMEHESSVNPTQALYEDELPQASEQSVKIYQSMVEALAGNKWDGDRDNWPETVQQEDWSRVTTDHRQCTGRRCSNVSACSFLKSRDSLGSVDCIVANHDLVLADLALGGGAILPDPAETIYIFDEGHHLPDKALNHFAHHSRVQSTTKWLDQCNKQLGVVLGQISGAGNVDHFGEQLPAALMECKRHQDLVWPLLQNLADDIKPDERTLRYRFEQGVVPGNIQLLAVELARSFDRLSDLLDKMGRELSESMDDSFCKVPKVDLETSYTLLGNWQARAAANQSLWASYASPDKSEYVPTARWFTVVESSGYLDFEVCSSPILAAGTLRNSLWQNCFGAVVTSATLTALGRFDRYQMRAGTPSDSHYQVVPSPFDFSAAELCVPAEAVDANEAQAHSMALIKHIPVMIDKSKGSLVLFSSRRQMEEVNESLPVSWQELILVQGDRSKQEILVQHKKRIDQGKGSIIFGLASFAEGVDLPGEYCTHVVIAKIPFAVPDDPVEAALAEWIEARGGNAFMEISVPDAALKLVQACGRLLRSETDRGTITLFDRRMISRRYGKAILNSLPPFTRNITSK